MTPGGTPRLPTATGFAGRQVLAELRNRGIDPAPLLERLGLSEQGLKEDQIRISAAAQARLLEYAAEALHDPALGFHLATQVNPREVGLTSSSNFTSSAFLGSERGRTLSLESRLS